jgi:hypothetical protein
MIRPSDPLVISEPGFRSNFVGWSDPTRSDQTRYRIHRPGCSKVKIRYIHIKIEKLLQA